MRRPQHRRAGRRLSEREVSESNLVAVPMVSQRDVSTSLDMTEHGNEGASFAPQREYRDQALYS